MHDSIGIIIQRFQDLSGLLVKEKECIMDGAYDQLKEILEAKAKHITEIDLNLKFFLPLEDQKKELYDLIVSLKILEDENIALMRDKLDKIRKEKSNIQSTATIIKNYTQSGIKESGIPKFFDKKK